VAIIENDYRKMLEGELRLRCAANPSYSLRAFARDLGAAPSMISQVLAGKRGLSHEGARAMASRLGWEKAEALYFCTLVESQHSRSPIRRESARAKLEKYFNSGRTLNLDAFQTISDCEHFAIHETLRLADVQGNPKKAAERLGLSEASVTEALERMSRLKLVKRDAHGRWRVCERTVFTVDEVPSSALRTYHNQVLSRASQAIHRQKVHERHYISTFLAIDPRHLPEIKAELRAFNELIMNRYGSKSHARETYGLGLQFFRVTTPSVSTEKSKDSIRKKRSSRK
jgi:uncharacterized protein (TIGR02147 family)